MGIHDEYGKRVLLLATNGNVVLSGPNVKINLGAGQPARIDGVVGVDIAVEVESRTAKQVRGAVLDLICHPYPKKLLLLLPVHMNNPDVTAKQCEHIMEKFLPIDSFCVLLLSGNGNDPKAEHDAMFVSDALAELGYQPNERAIETIKIKAFSHDIIKTEESTQSKRSWKYEPLQKYLQELSPSKMELSISFKTLEKILDFSLPISAMKYREWWSNQSDVSNRPQAKAWTNAGFRVDTVRQQGKESWVRFVRL